MGAAEGAQGHTVKPGAKWHFSKMTSLLEDLEGNILFQSNKHKYIPWNMKWLNR